MGDATVRTIGVVTVSRSDYGLYLPILKRISEDANLNLKLFASGTHLSREHGSTYKCIENDGFKIIEWIETTGTSDTPESISISMGMGTIGFAKAFQKHNIDILLVLGDRYEMHAAVISALPFRIPVAHIHGGEITKGAIDNLLRNSITKLSHIHFAATEISKQNIINMGEEPWRVLISGAPALDNLQTMSLLDSNTLFSKLNVNCTRKPLIVTYHPVTLEYEQTEWQTKQLLQALRAFKLPIIFTMPNADTYGSIIRDSFKIFTKEHPNSVIFENLGTQDYFSLMANAAAMVGNSSSGIVEAPTLELPTVNIGSRQSGRERAKNVIDVSYEQSDIIAGIKKALSTPFKKSLEGISNPYAHGNASTLIVNKLKTVELDEHLVMKPH